MNEHITSFKNLIEELRKEASRHFVTFKQVPLSILLLKARVHKQFSHPKEGMSIIEWLEAEGYFQKHKRSYKWNEPETKEDAEAIATRAYVELSREVPKKRPYTKRKNVHDIEEIKKEEYSSKEQKASSKCHCLGEKGFFLYNNVLSSGILVGMEYEMAMDENFSGPFHVINYNKTICKIVMDQGGIIEIYLSDFFPSPELLLKALEVRFKISQKPEIK